jgi:hypothetical protein
MKLLSKQRDGKRVRYVYDPAKSPLQRLILSGTLSAQKGQEFPFDGEWEQILSWLMANPERSSGDIFRELQHRSPGRYQPLQIRTLQRGMRKIRAFLLETVEEQWQAEVICGPSLPPISAEARPTGSS